MYGELAAHLAAAEMVVGGGCLVTGVKVVEMRESLDEVDGPAQGLACGLGHGLEEWEPARQLRSVAKHAGEAVSLVCYAE